MSLTLDEFNSLSETRAYKEMERCCGSTIWIRQMIGCRPFKDINAVYQNADRIWKSLSKKDWIEAFEHHPRIGDVNALREKFASTSSWASQEQKGAADASEETLKKLAKGNAMYERRFGHIFLVCATGKTADADARDFAVAHG